MKFKFSRLSNEEGRRYLIISMITKWFDFHLAIVPYLWNEFYASKDGQKYLDREIRYCLALSVIQFILLYKNGTKCVHVIVDEDKTYYPLNMQVEVNTFKRFLRSISEDDCDEFCIGRMGMSMLMNWSEKPNSSRIFYLTIRQDYLIVNNWGLFLNMRYPEVWMSQEDIEYYFPKKWTFKTNKKIPYKKIEKYEDLE
jgi:hypothetical protein